jgi:hypothetical protein
MPLRCQVTKRLKNCQRDNSEIRPFKNGWQCFEGPGVQPYWTGDTAKEDATGYASARAKFGRGEIRVLNVNGSLERAIPFDRKPRKRSWFKRHSQFVETGATTMNSTPLVIANSATTTTSGNIDGVPYSGTSTTSLPPTVIPAHPPQAQTMDEGSLLIAADLRKEKQLIVEGKTIAIESADASRLVYMIQ